MFLFILSIIILLVAVIAGIAMAAEKELAGVRKVVFIAGPILSIILLICSLIKVVPTGHTGVVTTFGHVEDYTYEAGVHFDAPWKKLINMDNRTRGARIELNCFSSDIQETTVTYVVNYKIDPSNAQTIYRTIGKEYFDIVVQPKVQESVKGVFAKYNAESLIEKRGILSTEIEEILSKSIEAYGIQIIATSIENIDFTDTFTNAVEAKQVAEQNKLRAKTEQEQKIIEANAQAEQVKIDAQAKADAEIIAANAQAEVAKIGADAAEYQGIKDAAIMSNLGEMLAKYPSLVDYYRATGWDGKLPETYLGGDGTVLFDITK